LPISSRWKVLYLAHLSTPAADRTVYRAIGRRRATKILELGIGNGRRAVRMIQAAGHRIGTESVRYVGLDPFEARTAADGPGVTLKMAHRLLTSTGARVRLLPGDPLHSLAVHANQLGQYDLIVVSSRLDRASLAGVWFYVPRLLHAKSQVMLESTALGGKLSLRSVSRREIESLASETAARRAA